MYGYGYSPLQHQARMQQMQPQVQQPMQLYPQYQQQSNMLKGRVVSSVEEARAAQIEFDGSVFYFPSPSENKVYLKGMDMSGNVFFDTYTRSQPKESPKQEDVILKLQERIERLERELEGLTNGIIESSAGIEASVRPNTQQANVG